MLLRTQDRAFPSGSNPSMWRRTTERLHYTPCRSLRTSHSQKPQLADPLHRIPMQMVAFHHSLDATQVAEAAQIAFHQKKRPTQCATSQIAGQPTHSLSGRYSTCVFRLA